MNTVTKLAAALVLIVTCFHTAAADYTPAQISKWQEASNRGESWAQYSLGAVYQHGLGGTTKDMREAVKWYRKAAEQGEANSQFQLGWAYWGGEGVTKDWRESAKWYRKAAERGHDKAQTVLGIMYDNGFHLTQDKREAVKWYRKAAEQGNDFAQFSLGYAYWVGDGVTEDTREAVRWYRKAARQGEVYSQYSLGLAYWNGEGVAEDKREAVKWYRKAAEQGETEAQNNLGAAYANGEGVITDDYEAYIWYSIAKAGGNENAAENLRKKDWYLSSAAVKAARREAAARLADIDARKAEAESDDPLQLATVIPQPDTAARVFDSAWQSIVYIESDDGQGSGVIIGKNRVATNCHVVDGKRIKVFPPQTRQATADTGISARIKTRDTVRDFCVLSVPGVGGVVATARRFATLKIGETVYALGAPKGLELTLSRGLISQLRNRGGKRIIQTDTAVSPGSSGGGLFDAAGNFIGITTSVIDDDGAQALNFAIPADLILR